ncbi:MAG: large subunit ribosomal protein L5 [Candidatus Saganbacteria bacterium]|uniref:Large ribosomal subunit protein uL5 n=1 Tax=Candidatus Saganbacteria bacterium TaxID=2575572 RepID=A0A833L199_UNCSA|nr:MAG: large subunit ribosomal protein L5 [Candidatus Saganbacteria bacterium]
MNELKEKYLKKIVPEIKKKFGLLNAHQVPKLVKIVLSEGISDGGSNPKSADIAALEMTEISGQKAVIKKAKKSIAAFKLKSKDAIGCMVTLRGERMYLFFNKLINICLPKIRDFRGLNPNSFDGRGNYSFGLKEQLIFPEVDYDKIDKVRGMNITIVTTAKNNEEAKELLKLLGIPFVER